MSTKESKRANGPITRNRAREEAEKTPPAPSLLCTEDIIPAPTLVISDDDSPSSSSEPTNQINLDQFFKFMVTVVHQHDAATMFKDGYCNLEAQVERDILFYKAGQTGQIPNEWIVLYNQFTTNQRDIQMKQYMKLHDDLKDKLEVSNRTTIGWIDNFKNGAKVPIPIPKKRKRSLSDC